MSLLLLFNQPAAVVGTVDLFKHQISNVTEKQFLKDVRNKQQISNVTEKRFIKWVL